MEIYYMKGAPERVLQQCTSYYKQGFNVPIGAKDGELFGDAVAVMSSKGLRGTVWRDCFLSPVFIQRRKKCSLQWRVITYRHFQSSRRTILPWGKSGPLQLLL